MVSLAGHRVVASNHAADRALRRVSLLRGADRVAANYWVEQTVARALRDGRRARRCPRWCVSQLGDYRRKTTGEGVVRFFWNETETAAFVATQITDAERGGRIWLVKTVIVTTDSGS